MARTDRELVEAVLEGDSLAFAEIIERYQRLVFNTVYHYLGNRAEVEDLSQEVFLKVFRSLDSFDTARPMKSWISRIAANACLDEIRKRRHRKTQLFSDLARDDDWDLESLSDRLSSSAMLTEQESERLFGLLSEGMQELNENDRMAFVLRELEGLSYAELAETFEATELAVRIRVSRSKKKLRQFLIEAFRERGKPGHG